MNTLIIYIDKGGLIVWFLLALNVIGFSTMIWKRLQIWQFAKNRTTTITRIQSSIKNVSSDTVPTEILKAEITAEIFYLDKGLNLIQTIATISPLIGLLGTVVGVLMSFEAVSQSGLDDPKVFASGVSMALITTVSGLIVAIPHYIGYNYLTKKVDLEEVILYKNLAQ